MKITNIGYSFLLPLANALTTPPINSLTHPSPNNATAGFPQKSSNLGLPIGPTIVDVEHYYHSTWKQGASINATQSAHLFYNLFVTLLLFWNAPNDGWVDATITSVTPQYRDIEIVIAPGWVGGMTTTQAGAVVWEMMGKCTLSDQYYYWTAFLQTRTVPPVEVGSVRAETRSIGNSGGSDSVALKDGKALSSLHEGGFPNATQGLSSNETTHTITTDTRYRWPISGLTNPQAPFLAAILSFSTQLLLRARSTISIIFDEDFEVICRTVYTLPNDRSVTLIARPKQLRAGARLTYGEFMEGLRDVLETMVEDGRYEYFGSTIRKDGELAATLVMYGTPSTGDYGTGCGPWPWEE